MKAKLYPDIFLEKMKEIEEKGIKYVTIKSEEDLKKLNNWKIGTIGLIGQIALSFFSTRVYLDEFALDSTRGLRDLPESLKTNDVLVQTIKRVNPEDGFHDYYPDSAIMAYYWGLKSNQYTGVNVDGTGFSIWSIKERAFFADIKSYNKAKKRIGKSIKENCPELTIDYFIIYNKKRHEIYKRMLIKNGSWDN